MKVAVTYTERWRRTVVIDLDEEFDGWMAEAGVPVSEATASDVKEFLEADGDFVYRWGHDATPGSDDRDEFDYLDIDEVEIPTAAELAAEGLS